MTQEATGWDPSQKRLLAGNARRLLELSRGAYWIPGAAVAIYDHRLGDLKQWKSKPLTALEARKKSEIKVLAGPWSLQRLWGRNLPRSSGGSRWPLAGGHIPPVFAFLSTRPFFASSLLL